MTKIIGAQPKLNNRLLQYITLPILLLDVIFTFFIRGTLYNPLIITTSSLALLVISIISALLYSSNKKTKKHTLKSPSSIYWYLFCSICISFFLNVFFLAPNIGDKQTTVVFFAEVILNFAILFSIFQIVSSGLVKPRWILTTIQIASLTTIIPVIQISLILDSIRRIGTGSGEAENTMTGAVGQIGLSLAVVFTISLYRLIYYSLYERDRLFLMLNFFLTSATFTGLLLTGKRSVFIGIFICAILLFSFVLRHSKVKILLHFIIAASLVTSLVFGYFSYSGTTKYAALFNRYTDLQLIDEAFTNRLEDYSEAFNSVDNKNYVIFGQMWRYHVLVDQNQITYPHNYLISSLLHFGIIPALFIGLASLRVFFILSKKCCHYKGFQSLQWIALLSVSFVILAHMSSAGPITRVFVPFFWVGFIESIFKRESLSL